MQAVSAARRLPAPPTPLVGRSDDLAALVGVLRAAGTRLVTVTGPPGVGKTRLALEAAAAFDGDRAPAWLDLTALRSPDLLLPEVLATLEHAAERSRPAGAGAAELLLVLDNCEHLLAATAALGALLADRPGLQILATSRERMRLAAEREFPLAPLPMPTDADVGDLERLAANPAIALLLARAPANVTLTGRTARSLADVCVRVDGVPLALELAAARLRVFTPGELAFRLGHQMDVLTSGPRDAPARHRDIRAALAWSHDLLPDAERTVFRRLSVLVGDWTLEAATAVGGTDAVDAVESLVDKSLVRSLPGDTGRFRMLASIQEFAAAEHAAHGEEEATRNRHAAYFADQARVCELDTGTARETEAWLQFGRVHPDVRTAFAHHRDAADRTVTLWLATGLGWFAYTRGVLAGADAVVATVHAAVADAAVERPCAAAALIAAGIVELASGDFAGAERDLQRAEELAERDRDDRHVAMANAFLGHVAREREEFGVAARHYVRAREKFERLGHGRGTAWASHDLGVLALERGDLVEADELLRTALEMFREVEYDWAVAVSAAALADVLTQHGRIDEPAVLYAEAVTRHERVGDRRGIAHCLDGLAELALARRTAATAARLHGAALAEREAVAARPTAWEQRRIDELDTKTRELLGPPDAQQQRQAGRRLPWPAVLELVGAAVPVSTETGAADLTGRQAEVAALVAAGRTNRQIARELGISEKTAEVHVRNIMTRLRTGSRAGIAAWAVAHGLIPPP